MKLAKGFFFNGISVGIKKQEKKDLGLIYSEKPAQISAVFTTNKIKAAPIKLGMKRIKEKNIQAVIVNSGNANACTGNKGYEDVLNITEKLAKELGLNANNVIMSSTGIIGYKLPVEKICENIPDLVKNLDKNKFEDFCYSILTTDTKIKQKTIKFKIDNLDIILNGTAKGAGMMAPSLATLLCFVITDVSISKTLLQKALKNAITNSFNSISIDGDTSTNDTILILANGCAGNKTIEKEDENFNKFSNALNELLLDLAKQVVKDGEGITKFIKINVKNANSFIDAKKVAFSIANSPLVKIALFGENPNWGRLMMAIGKSGAKIKSEFIDIYLEKEQIVKNSLFCNVLKNLLEKSEIEITVDLKIGLAKATVYTTDFSYDYVKINAEYN
ncbi:MAG: bifunctional glutamate N-acetyltransferase/amino-acid acetyltransferase ArgJ [bacterium]